MIALLVLVVCFSLVGLLLSRVGARNIDGVPSAKGSVFFLGHSLMVKEIFSDKKLFLQTLLDEAERLGRSFTLNIVNQPPQLLITKEESARHVLSNLDIYRKDVDGSGKLQNEELLGNGIFLADGALWQFHRKAASYMFSTNVMRRMVDVFNEHGHTMLEVLEGNCRSGDVVDIQELFQRFTMDSICRIAFGVHFDSLHLPQGDKPEFSYAFDYLQELTSRRGVLPISYLWVTKKFQLTQFERDVAKCAATLDRTILDVLRKREKQLKEGGQGAKDSGTFQDLLTQFVKMAHEKNEKLDVKFCRDVCLNFIIAGRDTTACLLSWTIYELCRHPDMETRVVEEIAAALNGGMPDYDNVKELDFTERFIMEVLRLHAPVPLDVKRVGQDDYLPDGTFVPRGSKVIYGPWIFGRASWLWDDPLELRPERWIDSKHSDYKFLTFNAGPRLCLGKRMAIVEAKVVLSLLLPRFRFRLLETQTDDIAVGIILWFRDGLKVVAQRR
mmetsp:Transcript_22735/g.63911  ORF Transcript_22735/g.63911 Transcript_22735/m.63911 type:complete len:499 (+) Transcript_22735:74-1570(+)